MIVSLDGVTFTYRDAETAAVRAVDLHVAEGELVGIVGPNGSGKTTLARLMVGLLRPQAGTVTVLDRGMAEWSRRDLARVLGVVAQREEPVFPLKVDQAVMLGRYPHMRALRGPTSHDRRAVEDAIVRCDIAHLRARWVATLSGGEWQRVRIARALAQQPRALILDEATANLDIRHEMEVFELVAALVRADGIGGVVVTHHVNLAARFADRIVVMHRGQARATGTPADVLTQAVLEDVFEWPVDVVTWGGAPQFLPRRRSREETGRGP